MVCASAGDQATTPLQLGQSEPLGTGEELIAIVLPLVDAEALLEEEEPLVEADAVVEAGALLEGEPMVEAEATLLKM